MQHFGAEIGQFGGFVIGDLIDGARFGNKLGVSGFYAVDVGPDDRLLSAESGAQDGGGIVGAAAAERCGNALQGRADEAGHDGHRSLLQKGAQALLGALAGVVHQGFRAPVMWIGDDDVRGRYGDAGHAEFIQGGGEQGRGEALAHAGYGVERARRQFPQQGGAL